MQKTGVLKVVASTGGLRLFSDKEGVWNNPAKDVTPEILEHLKALKGKNVVIIFNDKGWYISCELSTADNKEIATYPTNENKSTPQTAKSEAYPKMNVSVSLSKDYNTIKLELLDVEMKGDLSRRIQEKINFLKTEINKAHDNIEGEKK